MDRKRRIDDGLCQAFSFLRNPLKLSHGHLLLVPLCLRVFVVRSVSLGVGLEGIELFGPERAHGAVGERGIHNVRMIAPRWEMVRIAIRGLHPVYAAASRFNDHKRMAAPLRSSAALTDFGPVEMQPGPTSIR